MHPVSFSKTRASFEDEVCELLSASICENPPPNKLVHGFFYNELWSQSRVSISVIERQFSDWHPQTWLTAILAVFSIGFQSGGSVLPRVKE